MSFILQSPIEFANLFWNHPNFSTEKKNKFLDWSFGLILDDSQYVINITYWLFRVNVP